MTQHVRTTATSRAVRSPQWRIARAVAILASSLLAGSMVVACTASGTPNAESSPRTQVTVAPFGAADIVGDWGVMGVDAEPVSNSSDMLKWSDIVVSGTVGGLSEGSYTAPSNGVVVRPVIARLDNVVVVDGELPTGSDGSVYVALVAPAGIDAVAKGVPVGTPMTLYGWQVNPADPANGQASKVEGIPDGQPLYGSAHPAGLILQYGTADTPILVWPELGGIAKGLTLDSVLPGNDLAIAQG